MPDHAEAAEQRDRQAAALRKKIAKIETAQKGLITQIEQLTISIVEVPVLLDLGCRIGPAHPAGRPAHPAGYDITFTLMLPWQH